MRTAAHKQIDQPWTSLFNITEAHTDRNKLCVDLINNLLDYLEMFKNNGLEPFLPEWQLADSLMNKTITLQGINKKTLQGINKKTTGTVKGINNKGHLLLKTNNGKIEDFSAGDVSVVK